MSDAELRTQQATEAYEARSQLRSDLMGLLNSHSAENASGTPDCILADYLLACLDAFDYATRGRDSWWNYHYEPVPDGS